MHQGTKPELFSKSSHLHQLGGEARRDTYVDAVSQQMLPHSHLCSGSHHISFEKCVDTSGPPCEPLRIGAGLLQSDRACPRLHALMKQHGYRTCTKILHSHFTNETYLSRIFSLALHHRIRPALACSVTSYVSSGPLVLVVTLRRLLYNLLYLLVLESSWKKLFEMPSTHVFRVRVCLHSPALARKVSLTALLLRNRTSVHNYA